MDNILILVYITILFHLIFYQPQKAINLTRFVSASIIAIIWGILSKELYSYNKSFIKFADITLFPVFAWALGLFFIYQLYKKFENKLSLTGFWRQFPSFIILYWICLICMESIGYYILDIKNLATAQYEGIPFFKCIHAPYWMQIVYFSLGPLYFITCHFNERIAEVTTTLKR